jgi:hypothetical protein
MNASLRKLITAYQAKARKMARLLAKELNIKLPITNNEWAALQIDQRGTTSKGLKYFKHGYGVAIRHDGWEIDIDFGDKGEIDGFDAHKLFNFAGVNGFQIPYKNETEIESEIKRAVRDGEVRHCGRSLYYIKNET